MKLFLDPAVNGSAGGAGAAPAVAQEPPKPAAAAAAPPAPASAAVEPAKVPTPAAEPAKAAWMKVGDEAAKKEEPAKTPEPEKKAPEKFALKVPEGASIEAAALEKLGADYQSLGITQEQAQKLLDKSVADQKAQNDAVMSQLKQQNEGWQKEHQAKYGEKYGEIGEKLKRVFDYGDKDGSFRKTLESMHLAHNPQLLAFAEKFIPLFEDPSLKQPSRAANADADTRTPQERLVAKYEKRFAPGGASA